MTGQVTWLAVIPTTSSGVLPLVFATCVASRSDFSPTIVAATTFWGLFDRRHFVLISDIPAASTTARTAPPAITPVPGGAGFSSTLPAPKTPMTSCGIVLPDMVIVVTFFFASSMPLRIASDTSPAFPSPNPTLPLPSPTTHKAANLNMRPPLTVLETRFRETTFSVNSDWASSFLLSRLLSRLLLL